MPQGADQNGPDERAAAAAYLAALTADLARIARENGFSTLSYLMDMARLEAQNVVRTHEDRSLS